MTKIRYSKQQKDTHINRSNGVYIIIHWWLELLHIQLKCMNQNLYKKKEEVLMQYNGAVVVLVAAESTETI